MKNPLSPLAIGAPAANEPCTLHKVHYPSVVVTYPWYELPNALLNELTGETVWYDEPIAWVCGTGLDSLLVCVDYMLGRGPAPSPRVGPATWNLAHDVIIAFSQRVLEIAASPVLP